MLPGTLRFLLPALLAVCAGCTREPQSSREPQSEIIPSGITLRELTDRQVDSLVITAKVWGFLKYHHPRVTAGHVHWDAELLRRMPAILAATDRPATRRLLVEWIDSLGAVDECSRCASLEGDVAQRPRLEWLRDADLLGDDLVARLGHIYKNRAPFQQFYVSTDRTVGKPLFEHEPEYRAMKFPDAGLQMLGVLRYWNAIEYWFPYRDLIDENWDEVLRDTLPRIVAAADAAAYRAELAALTARVDDGHAFVEGGAGGLSPPPGTCRLPALMRYVEGEFVIKGFTAGSASGGFELGDILVAVDGRPVRELVAEVRRYYTGSYEAARMRVLLRALTRGECGRVRVRLRRDTEVEIDAERVPSQPIALAGEEQRNDRAGASLQYLSPDVAYLKLAPLTEADLARHLREIRSVPALIVDMRAYPDYLIYPLGGALVEKTTPFARFTKCDLSNPGGYFWRDLVKIPPDEPRYPGRVAVLVDESTQSRGEYFAMALAAAPRTTIVGARTAGADGDVAQVPMPGGLVASMSGNGVFYPDRSPTQQVGVKIDVPCVPTIAGIRAGRDEILECALQTLNSQRLR
jgi:C-terminal processing protease CtpA/Prc